MKKLMIIAVCWLMTILVSCHPTEQTFSSVENGPFKVVVRSQEFHHSAIRNVDVCVTETSSSKFPSSKSQCFLHGFDFTGLSVRWRGQREIEVSFQCGRVTHFANDAVVYPKGPAPEEFHTTLRENCGYTQSMTCQGN
jgi:hypothetical protein